MTNLKAFGLIIAPEKVQEHMSWKYLGMLVTNTQVMPQPVKLDIDVKTATDVQKLVGLIGWIRSHLGITNHQMQPLFDLLSGITSSTDRRQLTPATKKALEEIESALAQNFFNRIDTSVGVQLFILKDHEIPCGILCQWSDNWEDQLHILEWIFLTFRSRKTAPGLYELFADIIIKGRRRCHEILGHDPVTIVIPVQQWYFEWCFQNNHELQSALSFFTGQIKYHLPSHPVLKLTKEIPFEGKQICSPVPVDGITVFTDGSGKTGKAAVAWRKDDHWEYETMIQQGSLQLVELCAVLLAFTLFPGSVNIVTDSIYVANLVKHLDQAVLYNIQEKPLFITLVKLWTVIGARKHPYFIMHICSHTSLPGFFCGRQCLCRFSSSCCCNQNCT